MEELYHQASCTANQDQQATSSTWACPRLPVECLCLVHLCDRNMRVRHVPHDYLHRHGFALIEAKLSESGSRRSGEARKPGATLCILKLEAPRHRHLCTTILWHPVACACLCASKQHVPVRLMRESHCYRACQYRQDDIRHFCYRVLVMGRRVIARDHECKSGPPWPVSSSIGYSRAPI